MNNKVKYIILAVFVGIICKMYDDLVDCNLYSNFGISSEKKPYVDDILKSLFIISYTILSIENPIFFLFFLTTNGWLYIKRKEDFHSYEFSGFISPIILLPFLKWNNIIDYKKIILWVCLIALGIFVFITKTNLNADEEYSTKKMRSRCISLFLTLITLFYSSYLDIPASILQLLYFSAGYTIISCITQYCLVNSIWKSDDTNNLEDSNISKVEKDIKIEPDVEEKSS